MKYLHPFLNFVAANYGTSRFYGAVWTALVLCLTDSVSAQQATPNFNPFQPLSLVHSSQNIPGLLPGQAASNPLLPLDAYMEQNQKILKQAAMTSASGLAGTRQQQLAEARRDLKEDPIKGKNNERLIKSKPFKDSYQEFLCQNPDSFSITKAVYLAESAYYDNPPAPQYQDFVAAIKGGADLVKQILKREGLNEKDNTALIYGIQKLYSQSNSYYNPKTKQSRMVERLHYDFDDFMGDKDWKKMFVTKLLYTESGQCHSLPLLFLCIAEQLHAKAYLSLAPNHFFIQYFDRRNNRYNFEATNGNLTSETFLTQNTFITATALKNKTYLDTLSSKKLFAQCLGDLLLDYIMKLGYDEFSDQVTKKILSIDSLNLTALMMQARLLTFEYRDLLKAANNPIPRDYPRYPELDRVFRSLEICQQKIEQTGFQPMPEEAYGEWMKSLNAEKQKQENKLQQEKMDREIKKLKNLNSKFTNSPKQ